MSESLRKRGAKLLRESRAILDREVAGARAAGDHNLAVRRAQEAVELAIKAALRILAVDCPKVHDPAPVLSEQARGKGIPIEPAVLERMEEISLWLAQARESSFYFERDFAESDARRACEDAGFVVKEIEKAFGTAEGPP